MTSSMSAVDHAVVGVPDLDAAAAFFARFGFVARGGLEIGADAARTLYGLGDAPNVICAAPGAARGAVRLVHTPHPPEPASPAARRGYGLDIDTRDLDADRAALSAAGFDCSDVAAYRLGDRETREFRVLGPGSTAVFLIEPQAPRPSILDDDPIAAHSEILNVVHLVDDVEASAGWAEALGLARLVDTEIDAPSLASLMQLDPTTTMRFVLAGATDEQPPRIGLMELPGLRGEAIPTMPLRAGIHGPAVMVDDLASVRTRLPMVEVSDVAQLPGWRAVTGLAPGGVRVELWQALS